MNTLNVAESIFFTALEMETPEARAAYLDDACKGDANMRRYIERMLNAHPKLDGFLQQSPVPRLEQDRATIEPPPIEERPGTIIGSYKLLQQLGEGGFGVVFMAEQDKPVRRKVALKIIKPGMDSKQVVARFEAERQALALMDHPNIARVFDGGTTDSGRPYFVMELVKGTPITEFCDKNRLTPRERLELFIPVCQAVQHAHQKGIIHRDIKPSNVLITMYDDKPVPKVIDFGIAKAIAEKLTEQTLFTRVGQVIGTLEYMSPEQASLNALDVDTRADVYALGVLLYELLTGSTPLNKDRIQGVAFLEMLRLIREEEPPKPSTRLSQSGDALTSYAVDRRTDRQKLPKLVKGELDWITMKALEKDRTRRYDSASAMAADVLRYLKDEQVEACPPSISYRLQKYARKHKTAFAMTSMAVSLLLFGIVATGWQALRAMSAEDNALTNEKIARDERDEAAGANVKLRDANIGLQTAREDMRRTLYFARSNLLQNAWDANNGGQVLQLLDQQRPGPGERDLREFEWHYRDRLCHQELLTITNLGRNQPMPLIPAFSPDGKYVVALAKQIDEKAGRDEIAIYSLADGTERTRLKFDAKRPTSSLQWSPDSKRVFVNQRFPRTPGGGGKLENGYDFVVCDAADGHEIYRVARPDDAPGAKYGGPGSYGSLESVFSPDGKYVSISNNMPPGPNNSDPGSIALCDAATGKILRHFGDPAMRAAGCVFSRDGRLLAAGLRPNLGKAQIKVWDVTTGEELLSKDLFFDSATVRFNPDGNQVAAITTAYSAKLSIDFTAWDLASGKEVTTFSVIREEKRLSGGRNFYDISPDFTRLAVWSETDAGPSEVRVHDTATGQVGETLRDAAAITVFQFSPDGKMAVAGARNSTVRVWDLGVGGSANGAPALVLRGHTSELNHLAFSPDSSRLFSAGTDGMIKVWDIAKRDRPVFITGKASRTGPVAFSATSGRILSVNYRRTPGGAGGGKAGKDKKMTPEEAANLGVVPRGQSQITVWDLDGKALGSFAGPVPSVSFGLSKHPIALSPDGKRLAIIAFLGSWQEPEGAELHVLETDTGKEIFMQKIDPPIIDGTALAFSRDGEQLAWAFAIRAAGDVPSQPVDALGGPRSPIAGQVKLLNAADGTEIRRITLPAGVVDSVTFSPDGTRLATSSVEKITIWDLRTGVRFLDAEGTPGQTYVESLVYSDDGTRLAGIGRSGRRIGEKHDVFVWDAATGKNLFTLPGHSRHFVNVAFSPNSRRIATASVSGSRSAAGPPGTRSGNEVKLWDAATGNELMTLKELDRNSAYYLSFSPDGTRLNAIGHIASGAEEKLEIRTWDATPREAK